MNRTEIRQQIMEAIEHARHCELYFDGDPCGGLPVCDDCLAIAADAVIDTLFVPRESDA